jgi:hypothetical protein
VQDLPQLEKGGGGAANLAALLGRLQIWYESENAGNSALGAAIEEFKNWVDPPPPGEPKPSGVPPGLGPIEGSGNLTGYDLFIETKKNEYDSLSELSEEQGLRLQTFMTRRAKMLETLSAMMKKMSQSKEAINQNMK